MSSVQGVYQSSLVHLGMSKEGDQHAAEARYRADISLILAPYSLSRTAEVDLPDPLRAVSPWPENAFQEHPGVHCRCACQQSCRVGVDRRVVVSQPAAPHRLGQRGQQDCQARQSVVLGCRLAEKCHHAALDTSLTSWRPRSTLLRRVRKI